MKRTPQKITDTELAVLKVLWDHGPISARGITERLYPDCTDSDLGTVHSMLKRLEAKDMIARDRGGHVHLFSAKVERSLIAGQQLEEMADKLADGSLAPFLSHLVQANRLDNEEIQAIRRMLDDLAANKKRKKG